MTGASRQPPAHDPFRRDEASTNAAGATADRDFAHAGSRNVVGAANPSTAPPSAELLGAVMGDRDGIHSRDPVADPRVQAEEHNNFPGTNPLPGKSAT